MQQQSCASRVAALAALAVLTCLPTAWAGDTATHNAALVAEAFEDWRAGTGNVFDLLAEDAVWTVAGDSPVSGTYKTREALMTQAVLPIHARLATPITPQVNTIVAQGDDVVVFWDGVATARDGSPYENSYAWHLTLAGGEIIRVTAFLDTWRLHALME